MRTYVSLFIIVATFFVASVAVNPALAQTVDEPECWVYNVTESPDYYGLGIDGVVNTTAEAGDTHDEIFAEPDLEANVVGVMFVNEVRQVLEKDESWYRVECTQQELGAFNIISNPLDGDVYVSTDEEQEYTWQGGRLHWDNIPSTSRPAHNVVVKVPGATRLIYNGMGCSVSNSETGMAMVSETNGAPFQFIAETELFVMCDSGPTTGFEIVFEDWAPPLANEMVGRRWYSPEGLEFSMTVGGDAGHWWWQDKLSSATNHSVSGFLLPGQYAGDFIDGSIVIEGGVEYGPGNGVVFSVTGSDPVSFEFYSISGGSFWRTDVPE